MEKNLRSIGQFLPKLVENLGVNAERWAVLETLERQMFQLPGVQAKVAGWRRNTIYVEAATSTSLSELVQRKREVLKWVEASWPKDADAVLPEVKFYLAGLNKSKNKPDERPKAAAQNLEIVPAFPRTRRTFGRRKFFRNKENAAS